MRTTSYTRDFGETITFPAESVQHQMTILILVVHILLSIPILKTPSMSWTIVRQATTHQQTLYLILATLVLKRYHPIWFTLTTIPVTDFPIDLELPSSDPASLAFNPPSPLHVPPSFLSIPSTGNLSALDSIARLQTEIRTNSITRQTTRHSHLAPDRLNVTGPTPHPGIPHTSHVGFIHSFHNQRPCTSTDDKMKQKSETKVPYLYFGRWFTCIIGSLPTGEVVSLVIRGK